MKSARIEQGMTQPQVVARVLEHFPTSKLTQGTYSTLERGNRPGTGAETLLEIAVALGLTLDYLVAGDERPVVPASDETRSPFELARDVFLDGARDRVRARAWLDESAFRVPSGANAREILDLLEASYVRHQRAEALLDAGGSREDAVRTLGGIGAQIIEAEPGADDWPKPLPPVKSRAKKKPR